ncbi:MAG: DUF192 domain-containing protein [Flavobacteriales bacterium]|nr:DUF192 domain-containing protein [Flavobacteriales bacterium]
MSKRRNTKGVWIRITAIGLIVVFIGGYIMQSFFSLATMRKNKTADNEQVTHVNIPFKAQGVVNIYEGHPGGALLYTGNIEIADNDTKRAQGLMYRDTLASDQGMLFIFPKEEMQSFWMKNTRISLDIIYINSEGKIVSIAKNAKPYDETSRPSLEPAQYVLELPGGTSDALGLGKGNVVSWVEADQ